MGIVHIGVFIGAIVALSALPGPDMMFIISRSVAHGRSAGALSVFGITTAILVHTLIVALGIAALLRAVPTAYSFVRIAGAIYLLYLAGQALRASWRAGGPQGSPDDDAQPLSRTRLYAQAVMTGLLNPKTTLFFAAFLPQFVEPAARHLVTPYLMLGTLVAFIGAACDLTIALAAAELARRLRPSRRRQAWTQRLCGGLYAGLGLNLLREG